MLKKKILKKEDILKINESIIIIGNVGVGKSTIAEEIRKQNTDFDLIDCAEFYDFKQLLDALSNSSFILDNVEQFDFGNNLDFFIKELNYRIELGYKIIIFTTSEFFEKLYKKVNIYNFGEIPCAFDEAIKDILEKTKVDANIFLVRKIINNNLHYLIGAKHHMDYFIENIFNKITDYRKNNFIKIFYLELLSSFIEFKYDIKNLSKCKFHCIEEYFKSGCFLHQQFIDTFINNQEKIFKDKNFYRKYDHGFKNNVRMLCESILEELKPNNQLIIYSYEFCDNFIKFLEHSKIYQGDIFEIRENVDKYFLSYYIEKIQLMNDFDYSDINFIHSMIDIYSEFKYRYLMARLKILQYSFNNYIYKLSYIEQIKEIDRLFYNLENDIIISFCNSHDILEFIDKISRNIEYNKGEEEIDIENLNNVANKVKEYLKDALIHIQIDDSFFIEKRNIKIMFESLNISNNDIFKYFRKN